MRRAILIVSLYLIGTATCIGVQRKDEGTTTEIGLDIGAIMSRCALHLTAGRHLWGSWTLEGTHTFIFGRMIRGRSEDEEVHYNEFGTEEAACDEDTYDMVSGGLRVRYWIDDIYKGGYIMTGFRLGYDRGPDGVIGIGYSMKILNGWRCSLSYEMDIRRSWRLQRPAGNGLGLTLSYTY